MSDPIQKHVLFSNPKQQEIWAETVALADQNELTVVMKTDNHWHILGKGVRVNYYPFSKNQTAHVDGTYISVVQCSPADAVKLALTPPNPKKVMKHWGKSKPKPVVVALDVEQSDGSVKTQHLSNQPTGAAPWE